MSDDDLTTCDTCGRQFTWSELAEIIEERLCEYCASGIEEDDDTIWDAGYD